MTKKKIPEINLEVSCGGTFRVSTDELACRITVLLPEGMSAPNVPMSSPAAMPLPVHSEPVAPVVERVTDPFHSEAVRSCMEEVASVADTVFSALGNPPVEGSLARIGTAREALLQATEKAGNDALQLMTMLNKLQAQIVDLRFALTFLKNHAALKPRPSTKEDDVVIKAAEHSRIVARIADAIKNTQGINDQLSTIKKITGGTETPASTSAASLLTLSGKVQRDLFSAVFSLGSIFEQKQACENISMEQARRYAMEALAALTVAPKSSPAIESIPSPIEEFKSSIPEQPLITQNDTQEQGMMDLGEEMSDEEALRKLQEFGL